MIPHISSSLFPTPTRVETSPGTQRARLTELPLDEGNDSTTEVFGQFLRLGLSEHPDQRLRAGGADEHAAAAVQLRVEALRLGQRSRRHLAARDAHVLLR